MRPPIFAPLSLAARERLARSCERELPPRTIVFAQGDRGDDFYLVAADEPIPSWAPASASPAPSAARIARAPVR